MGALFWFFLGSAIGFLVCLVWMSLCKIGGHYLTDEQIEEYDWLLKQHAAFEQLRIHEAYLAESGDASDTGIPAFLRKQAH